VPKNNSHYGGGALEHVEYVFSLWQKVSKDKSSRRTRVERLFQRRGSAAVNARSPRLNLYKW